MIFGTILRSQFTYLLCSVIENYQMSYVFLCACDNKQLPGMPEQSARSPLW